GRRRRPWPSRPLGATCASRPAPDPDAPQLPAAQLESERGEAPPGARAVDALAAVGPIAGAVVAAHQRVVFVVEEARVAEVEREQLVAAGVEIGVEPAAPAHYEGVARNAFDHDREARARAFAQAPDVQEHAHFGEADRFHRASIQASRRSAFRVTINPMD